LKIKYDLLPTHCVLSIPSPRLGDRKHTTHWIKIISHHKTQEILYMYYMYTWALCQGLTIKLWDMSVYKHFVGFLWILKVVNDNFAIITNGCTDPIQCNFLKLI
jgi:hypothetical protein